MDINVMIDRQLMSLDQGMNEYPPNLPLEVHANVRNAINQWRSGDRDPALVLFLSFVMNQAIANTLRAKLHTGFTDLMYRVSS